MTIVISLECQLCILTCSTGYDILKFIVEYIVLIFYDNYGNDTMKKKVRNNNRVKLNLDIIIIPDT